MDIAEFERICGEEFLSEMWELLYATKVGTRWELATYFGTISCQATSMRTIGVSNNMHTIKLEGEIQMDCPLGRPVTLTIYLEDVTAAGSEIVAIEEEDH